MVSRTVLDNNINTLKKQNDTDITELTEIVRGVRRYRHTDTQVPHTDRHTSPTHWQTHRHTSLTHWDTHGVKHIINFIKLPKSFCVAMSNRPFSSISESLSRTRWRYVWCLWGHCGSNSPTLNGFILHHYGGHLIQLRYPVVTGNTLFQGQRSVSL